MKLSATEYNVSSLHASPDLSKSEKEKKNVPDLLAAPVSWVSKFMHD